MNTPKEEEPQPRPPRIFTMPCGHNRITQSHTKQCKKCNATFVACVICKQTKCEHCR